MSKTDKHYFKMENQSGADKKIKYYLLWHNRWFELQEKQVQQNESTRLIHKRFVYASDWFTKSQLDAMAYVGKSEHWDNDNPWTQDTFTHLSRLEALIEGEDDITNIPIGGYCWKEFSEDDNFDELDGIKENKLYKRRY